MSRLLLLGLLAATGCAAPAHALHTYRFTGRVVDDSTGAPLSGATVRIEAKTSPYGTGLREGEATTGADGTFELEIVDGWCHTVMIFPPLGTLGGSQMITLECVQLGVGAQARRPTRVLEREAARDRYLIRHRMGEVRR